MLPVHVGTPAKTFLVRVDTGNSALFLPSERCMQCQTSYTPTKSTTYSEVPCAGTCVCEVWVSHACGYKEQFAENTVVRGTISNDTIGFLDYNISNFLFVAFHSILPSLIGSRADGLFGLSPWATRYTGLNMLSQISKSVVTSGEEDFSLCLGEFGGQMVLGGYDELYVGSEISWVPMLNNSNFTIELTDFRIAGRSVWDSLWFSSAPLTAVRECINCTYVNIDSGHQYLVLPAGAYTAVKYVSSLSSS